MGLTTAVLNPASRGPCTLRRVPLPPSSQELFPELFVGGVARKGEGRKNIDCSKEDACCYVETIKH